jgi:hypothetical protein
MVLTEYCRVSTASSPISRMAERHVVLYCKWLVCGHQATLLHYHLVLKLLFQNSLLIKYLALFQQYSI